jgi:hypothetical protein
MVNLRPRDMTVLDDALSMHQGYVLNFSDRTFAEFFDAELEVDIDHSRYGKFGSSKAKRLRCFVQIEKSRSSPRRSALFGNTATTTTAATSTLLPRRKSTTTTLPLFGASKTGMA